MRKAVKKYIAEHYEDYVKDLEALTNIDSGNGDREGTEAANKFVAEKMTAIGATTEFRYNDRACHLISRLKGTGKYTILLVAHVDTVFKKGEAARRPFRVDENNFAWGPGVGDDKATVVEVIYGLEALKAAGFDNFKEIIYYTNGEEEGGSKTAEDIVAELSQQSDFAIIMDVARPNWGIVTQRKGNAKYRVEVTGKGGHHGNASQSCANAIHQLAYTITELQKLASPMPGNPEDYTAAALKARGIEPDFVMGDFDSLGYRPDHPNVETHPVMKDDTDLGLAVRWALAHGYRRLVMAGALGGRLDQTIASLQTLRGLTDAGAQGWLIGCGWVVTAVQNGTLAFPAGMEGTVSVFSSGDAARGVTLRGLLYEITDAELRCAMPLGVSNSFTGAAATVRVTDGTVFVLWQGNALPDGLEVRHGAD